MGSQQDLQEGFWFGVSLWQEWSAFPVPSYEAFSKLFLGLIFPLFVTCGSPLISRDLPVVSFRQVESFIITCFITLSPQHHLCADRQWQRTDVWGLFLLCSSISLLSW